MLRRAAYSPNIKERADCSAALFTADGELLVQAEHIPVHLGSMPASVRAAIDALGDRIEPGDQVVLNDPYAGGTHLNDVTLVAPCFVDGELVGWAANRAHHADLGGMAPGSMPPEAVDIQQEGLRIPPVLLTPGRRGDRRRELAHARRAARRPRRAARREPARRRPSRRARRRARVDRAARRGRRLRRATHARRAGGVARRAVPLRGRARLRRSASRAAVTDAGGRDAHRRRRARDVRLHRHRRAATRQRQRGRGGDRQRGRVRPALGDRPDRSPPTAVRCGRSR